MSDRESLDDQPQRYGNPGGMDAGGTDFDPGQQGQQGEQELATKMLQIQSKRFYLDVKQNRRGRFIKVAEIGADGRRSQIYLALSTASEFRNYLSTFSDFYASLGPPNSENVPDDGKLKSEVMTKDNRRYYLDLKENTRGRFLRVSQTITRGGPRTQIAIPAQGMIEFRDALTDLLEEYGTDDGGFKGDLPEGRYMRVDSKNFYFDIGQNNRGIYMRISEVKTHFRTAITVPEKSWERFRDIFADYCERMRERGAGSNVGMNSGGGGNVLPEGRGSVVAQNNLTSTHTNNPFNDTFQQIRGIKKHFNQKYRKERGQKFIKIELPDYNKLEFENDEIRLQMKKYGIMPQRTWNERPIYISSTPGIFESYIVPEGDGKFSPITTMGAKQKIEFINKKSKSFIALRKIKGYEENYTTNTFLEQMLDIYKKAHEALCTQKKDEILKYVTETAYPIMMHNIKNKTIIWKFMESLEPARLVHARVTSVVTQGNEFAQVTIRFHTQQILCIYDRFGRVLLGSEIVKKDVLDYIVFEKHLSNEYGIWRIHGKIIPDWMSPIEISSKTYILPKEKEKSLSTDNAVESVAEVVPPETLDKQHDNANT